MMKIHKAKNQKASKMRSYFSQAIISIIVNSILHISSHETFESTKFSMFLKSKLSFSFQFYLKSTAPWHKIFLFHFIIHSLNCIRLFQLFFFQFSKRKSLLIYEKRASDAETLQTQKKLTDFHVHLNE